MTLAVLALSSPDVAAQGSDSRLIELPLEIYIIEGAPVVIRGNRLESWISKDDVVETILPEVNRIWRQADIRWKLRKVVTHRIEPGPAQAELTHVMSGFRRDLSREYFIEHRRSLKRFASRIIEGRFPYRLFVIPYLGSTLQGIAMPGRKYAYLGSWTDKPSKGRSAPQKVKLREAEPFFVGSIARTAAHELGHLLGLRHRRCFVECLMGGSTPQGYLLTDKQVQRAREHTEIR